MLHIFTDLHGTLQAHQATSTCSLAIISSLVYNVMLLVANPPDPFLLSFWNENRPYVLLQGLHWYYSIYLSIGVGSGGGAQGGHGGGQGPPQYFTLETLLIFMHASANHRDRSVYYVRLGSAPPKWNCFLRLCFLEQGFF